MEVVYILLFFGGLVFLAWKISDWFDARRSKSAIRHDGQALSVFDNQADHDQEKERITRETLSDYNRHTRRQTFKGPGIEVEGTEIKRGFVPWRYIAYLELTRRERDY